MFAVFSSNSSNTNLSLRQWLNAAVAAIALLFSMFSTSDCSIIQEPIKRDTAIAFVTGIHMGSVYPDFNADEDRLTTALKSAKPDELRVFNATGEVSSSVIPVDIDWDAPKTTLDYNMESYFTDKLEPTIAETIIPITDGANYIEAIKMAAHYLNQQQSDDRIIFVSGNGLSDSGILKFAEGEYLDSEKTPDDIIAELSTQISFDDSLEGITIIWNDLGSTSMPQEALTPHELDRLKSIYTAVLCKYGINENKLHLETPGDHIDREIQTDKTVTLVSVIHDNFVFEQDYDETSALGFIGNRPAYTGDPEDFINDIVATAELERIAKMAKEHPSKKITITGYIALVQGESVSEHSVLSLRRAETVRDRLVQYGVTNEIIVVDKGNSESQPWARQEDRRVRIEIS